MQAACLVSETRVTALRQTADWVIWVKAGVIDIGSSISANRHAVLPTRPRTEVVIFAACAAKRPVRVVWRINAFTTAAWAADNFCLGIGRNRHDLVAMN
jgi:hypothetical protein